MTDTRSITIFMENGKTFMLSQDALKRLSGNTNEQKENNYVEAKPVPAPAVSESVKHELKELREQNELLWKAANGKLLTDIIKVESEQVKFKHEKVCQDFSTKLNDCYMRNSSKPLLCSDLAKDFWKCVNSKKQVSN